MADKKDDKPIQQKADLYKAEYLGSGTFRISKPKRKANKKRLSRVRNPRKRSRRVG